MAKEAVRRPAVAGYFYHDSPEGLLMEVAELVDIEVPREEVKGVVVPHAGLKYSGSVAGAVYSRINFPDTFILLGPNHSGVGADVAVMAGGVWEMPNGPVEVDMELARAIMSRSPCIEDDPSPHRNEHSLEVQIPILQFLGGGFKIVPITFKLVPYDTCRSVGSAIADAVREAGREAVVVASTDMTHFESRRSASAKDKLAIEKILALDADGLFDVVLSHRISMCGLPSTAAAITACKRLGATRAELIKYADSGDVTGDTSQVVGYAGALIR